MERRSRLLKFGVPTSLIIPGCRMEAQLLSQSAVLFFVTHDIPFEEQLEIILVDQSGHLLDVASLWGALTTGKFRELDIISEDRVEFGFFAGRRWIVQILSRYEPMVPFWRMEPIGAHRSKPWRRHFRISRAP